MSDLLGKPVWTSDGRESGRVDRLIIDPDTSAVQAVVIRAGGVLGRDVEAPFAALHADEDGQLHLTYTSDQLDSLPTFVENHYTAPPAGWVAPSGGSHAGMLWPAGYVPDAPSRGGAGDLDASSRRQSAAQLAEYNRAGLTLRAGDEVRTADGQVLGHIQQLVVDSESGQLVALRVQRGSASSGTVDISGDAIERGGDGVVTLADNADTAGGRAP